MEQNSNNKNLNPKDQEEVLRAALKKFGFLFPCNEEEVKEFEEVFGTTDIELPTELQDAQFLLKALQSQPSDKPVEKHVTKEKCQSKVVSIQSTPSNVDYYRRTLLAAEIVYELHQEMTLGHVKLQKLIYLSQRTENINLPVNFLKQAMGPYDPKMMRSIDKQLLEKKWFAFEPKETLKYKPLDRAGQHKADFEKFYCKEKEKVSWLINTFRKVKTGRIEIIATLFACWEELLKEGYTVNNDKLIQKFFSWSIEKEKFSETDVRKEIPWMIENNLIPIS